MDWLTQLMQTLQNMRMPGAQMPQMPTMGMPQSNGGYPWGIPAAPPPLPPAFVPAPRPAAPVAAPVAAARPMQAGGGRGIPVLSGGGSGQERNNGMNAQFYPKPRLGSMMQPRGNVR